MRLRCLSGLSLLISLFRGEAQSQDIDRDAGTSEFQFLETLVYARPAGLAGAYTSLAQGEDAIGYNPSGLSKQSDARTVSGTFRYHLLNVGSGNLTYAFPGALFGTEDARYAVSLGYINYGSIAQVDEEDRPSGADISPTSFNLSLTAARALTEKIRVGATVKVLSEYLGDFEGSQVALGWGADFGLLYQPNAKNTGLGLSLLNLGRKERSQVEGLEAGGNLPVSLKGGFWYQPLDLPKGRLAVDLEFPWEGSPRLAGGVEYAYAPSLQLRAGSRVNFPEGKFLFLKATDQEQGGFEGGDALKLAGGFTLKAEGIALDYAAQFWMGLSWVHVMTVRYAFI